MGNGKPLGFSLGYLGGGLLFLINVAMTLKPAWFGLADVSTAVRLSFASVAIRQHKNLCWFLVAYWFYIDGLATIIKMAVDFGLSIGLPSSSLITALLIVQFIGFPATLAFGKFADRYGARLGLWIGLSTYVVATACAAACSHSVDPCTASLFLERKAANTLGS